MYLLIQTNFVLLESDKSEILSTVPSGYIPTLYSVSE